MDTGPSRPRPPLAEAGTSREPWRDDQAIRALRPMRPAVDSSRHLDVLLEQELLPNGCLTPDLTVFLAGAECPFTCVFCDLWRYTLDGPTPARALPTQLQLALSESNPPEGCQLKLYNASNFFEARAVPLADEELLIELCAPFPRLVVECHPRLVGQRALDFGRRVAARMQVAMGLETVHPDAWPKLGKRSSPEDFARATGVLRQHGHGVRAFVLVGAPFVRAEESVDWACRSAAYAFDQGAEQVSLIPVRGGNGAMEVLQAEGHWQPPTLGQLEQTLDRCLQLLPAATSVAADLWDLEHFSTCATCFAARRERLQQLNLSNRPQPAVDLGCCSPAAG